MTRCSILLRRKPRHRESGLCSQAIPSIALWSRDSPLYFIFSCYLMHTQYCSHCKPCISPHTPQPLPNASLPCRCYHSSARNLSLHIAHLAICSLSIQLSSSPHQLSPGNSLNLSPCFHICFPEEQFWVFYINQVVTLLLRSFQWLSDTLKIKPKLLPLPTKSCRIWPYLLLISLPDIPPDYAPSTLAFLLFLKHSGSCWRHLLLLFPGTLAFRFSQG